ncbi:MAG TPA: transcriptional regulator, partial [Caulobacter sp.]|nr:transcriptional regulator [Caulobacter sp.]
MGQGGHGPQDHGLQGLMPSAALDRTLAALADPHRRRVVELLRERPRRAGDLA